MALFPKGVPGQIVLVGALDEEVSALLEDLSRLEAFVGQLRPVIGQPLAEEEAGSLCLSMLEHLPQRPLRLGDVRVRFDRAWRSGALPPGAKRRSFGSGRAPVASREPPRNGGERAPNPRGGLPRAETHKGSCVATFESKLRLGALASTTICCPVASVPWRGLA
ncbi:MAG TPA: hypothetical protein VGD78_18425 [Chthoniobacterales bacterium]